MQNGPQPTASRRPAWQINALATDTEILIYEQIGETFFGDGVTAKSFRDDLKTIEAGTPLTVRLNSPGGEVFDGFAIYQALKEWEGEVTVRVDGLAASIASVIAMAGDKIVMAGPAMLMIHDPWGYSVGNAAELRKQAAVMDQVAVGIAKAYEEKTGRSAEDLRAEMAAETWFTAEEALALGFADEINDAAPVEALHDLSGFKSFAVQAPRLVAIHRPATIEEDDMKNGPQNPATPANPPQPPAAPVVNADEIRAEALASEKTRRAAIRAVYAPFPGRADTALADCLDDPSVTAEAASVRLLAALAAPAAPIAQPPRIEAVVDEADKFRAAAVDSILSRSALAQVKDIAANPLRGNKLLDIARASLERIGVKTAGMDQMQIVAAAFTNSTSDFPVLLENTMHKAIQQAYATQPDTWSRFCGVGSVSDFRAHNRYRPGSFGNLEALNELGEFKNKSIPDGEKSTITASTKGNIINISRQAIINDDLGAFVGLAATLGRAARRTIEADVYAMLAQNSGVGPTMGDGKTLFHVDHGNIGTAGAISVESIDGDRVLMASQMDVSGNDYLDLRPSVLLVPVGLGGAARVIIGAEYDPDTANKLQRPNKVRGLVSDIVDTPRMSGTRRYMFANPGEAPVIEVVFLDGRQEPYLESQNGWNVDGAQTKVRLDYGIGAIDYRGATTNAGV